jgi:haloalkane dehalogenase
VGHYDVVDVLQTPDDRFATLPGFGHEPKYVEVAAGLRMHYVEVGPHEGPLVVLVHGQPTWSYLWRHVIDGLVAHGLRAVAPDLIGFGRSDKPTARTAHTVDAHVEWLRAFLRAVAPAGCTLVVQDWGGPLALGAVADMLEMVHRIVATNTALHTVGPELAGRLTWPCHTAPDGSVNVAPMLLDYQRITQELAPLAPSLFVQGATATDVPDAVLAAYDAPFPEEAYCAGPRQLPLLMGLTPGSACARLNRRTLEALGGYEGPFLTAFSDGDEATNGWAEVLQERVPGASTQPHTVIRGAGHFVQEDAGRRLADVVADLVASTPG